MGNEETETTKEVKKAYEKYTRQIIFLGGIVAGSALTMVLFKRRKTITNFVEVLPEWAQTWKKHCLDNDLLFDNGLPIFANEEESKIFRDAISEECDVQSLIESGFEIVERV